MLSITEEAAKLLRDIEETGMLAEIGQRKAAQTNERRIANIEKRRTFLSASEALLPDLAKALLASKKRVEKAREETAAAIAEESRLTVQLYAHQQQVDGDYALIDRAIQECAPDFIVTARDDLEWILDKVQQTFRIAGYEREEIGYMLWETKLVSNHDEIISLLNDLRAARKKLLDLNATVIDVDELGGQVMALVEPLHQRAFAIGVNRAEFNQLHSEPINAALTLH